MEIFKQTKESGEFLSLHLEELLAVQWLGLYIFTTKHFHCCGLGSVPGWGTKTPLCRAKRKQKHHLPCKFFHLVSLLIVISRGLIGLGFFHLFLQNLFFGDFFLKKHQCSLICCL